MNDKKLFNEIELKKFYEIFDNIIARFDNMDTKFDNIITKLDNMDTKLDEIYEKTECISNNIKDFNSKEQLKRINEIKEKVEKINKF